MSDRIREVELLIESNIRFAADSATSLSQGFRHFAYRNCIAGNQCL